MERRGLFSPPLFFRPGPCFRPGGWGLRSMRAQFSGGGAGGHVFCPAPSRPIPKNKENKVVAEGRFRPFFRKSGGGDTLLSGSTHRTPLKEFALPPRLSQTIPNMPQRRRNRTNGNRELQGPVGNRQFQHVVKLNPNLIRRIDPFTLRCHRLRADEDV